MAQINPFDQKIKYKFTNKIGNIKALGNTVIVSDMNFKERFTSGGIIIPGDDGKSGGIRPRWARVFAVGPDQQDVQVGEWICVAHGRWSRGIEIENDAGKFTIRKVDPKDILLSSATEPSDDTLSDAISGNPV
jgi:co-chaperonin GroES (HSP10)